MANLNSSNPFFSTIETPASPFTAQARAVDASDEANTGETGYVMQRRAPAPESAEVEEQGVEALEIVVRWGDQILHTAHLNPVRSFHVGDSEDGVDFVVPAEQLGSNRLELVKVEAGQVTIVAPAGAELSATQEGAQLDVGALISGVTELPGARAITLARGLRASISVGTLRFDIATVTAGKRVGRSIFGKGDRKLPAIFGATAAFAAALIATVGYTTPPMGLTEDTDRERQELVLMQQYLAAVAEQDVERSELPKTKDADNQAGANEAGEKAMGEEGEMGKLNEPNRNKRTSITKVDDGPVRMSRNEAIRQARQFGMIGILNDLAGDPSSPTVEWGADSANGDAEASFHGNLWADEIGESGGWGGLSLYSNGDGGGGKSEQVGFDGVGTCLGGLCKGPGTGISGVYNPDGVHNPEAPRLTMIGETEVSKTGIPRETIQRIVRRNFGRFRACYEQGLQRNPNLSGRVSVRFVVSRDGAVTQASNGGSDLADSGVVSCVVRAYYGLSFPSSGGGITTVTYPIVFQPTS